MATCRIIRPFAEGRRPSPSRSRRHPSRVERTPAVRLLCGPGFCTAGLPVVWLTNDHPGRPCLRNVGALFSALVHKEKDLLQFAQVIGQWPRSPRAASCCPGNSVFAAPRVRGWFPSSEATSRKEAESERLLTRAQHTTHNESGPRSLRARLIIYIHINQNYSA